MRDEAAIREAAIRPTVDLAALPCAELEAMARAGADIGEVYRVLAKTGDNVVGEILPADGTFYEWDHCPAGDIYDPETHAQFYYHAHADDDRFEGEHGHFHTFLRPKGMPPGIAPAPLADAPEPDDPDDKYSHLIAIAMTREGVPFRLFTVNRWVTGEAWHKADDVCAMLDHFDIDHAQPSWPVNLWVSGMVSLFRPQIETLVRARDRYVEAYAAQHPDRDIYEDRELAVTSYLDISVPDQLRAVDRAMQATDGKKSGPPPCR